MNNSITHHHFLTIPSTQEYLRNKIQTNYPVEHSQHIENEKIPNILISAGKQTQGQGRNGTWEQIGQGLAFSFTLSPNEVPTLTALEIGVLVVDFFQSYFNFEQDFLRLKWPNDIFSHSHKKCGGILGHFQNGTAIMGIGLNLYPNQIETREEFLLKKKIPNQGYLFDDEKKIFKKNEIEIEIPNLLYKHILSNRLNKEEILRNWQLMSAHMNQTVSMKLDKEIINGIFKGIGPQGEALILSTDNNERRFFSGSLIVGGKIPNF